MSEGRLVKGRYGTLEDRILFLRTVSDVEVTASPGDGNAEGMVTVSRAKLSFEYISGDNRIPWVRVRLRAGVYIHFLLG